VVEVEQDRRCGDDLSDTPRVEADVAQRLERHPPEAVTAFADGAQAVVCLVELLLFGGDVSEGLCNG
jgi:hypothetical protein